jgi:hypothetical protein
VSKVYDEATRTYAGSDGTDANCEAVFAALDPAAEFSGAFAAGGLGCFGFGPITFIRDTLPTTSTAYAVPSRRACACQ